MGQECRYESRTCVAPALPCLPPGSLVSVLPSLDRCTTAVPRPGLTLIAISSEGSSVAEMLSRLGLPAPALAAFVHSVLAFALLAQAYAAGSQMVELDTWLANALHANLVPSATTAFAAVTTLGSTLVLALLAATAAAYLLRRERGRDAALVVVAFVGAQLLTWILKATFERPRPSFGDPVATAGWFSFPSGHALSSIALYGALAYLLTGAVRSRRAQAAGFAGVALLVAAIGFSRLYLGVHYLTDVLAGYSAGLAWLLFATALLRVRVRRTRAERDSSTVWPTAATAFPRARACFPRYTATGTRRSS